MNRRKFLATTVGATAALTAGCGHSPQDRSAPASTTGAEGTLGGKTLEEIRAQYRYDLFKEYIPFHDQWVVDHEYGGFHVTTGWNGPTLKFEKSNWYEGRGTWTYSYLYNTLDPNPKHREAARRSVEFVMKHKPEGDALWPGGFTREGKASPDPVPLVYGDLFLAMGFGEFSKIKGNESYWELAKKTVLKCMKIYDRPGYYPDAPATYLGKDAPVLPGGARAQGHWFMFLNTVTTILRARPDRELQSVADRCVDMIMNKHYDPRWDLHREVLNHDLTVPDNDAAHLAYVGHTIETLWMVMDEAVRRRDKNLFESAAKRLKRHLEVSWDDVYGGVFRNLRNVDKNIWDVDKAGWVQMESLVGLLMVIEHTGADWAKQWFDRLYPWVVSKFPLKPYGLPLWMDYADRWVTFNKGDGSRRAENFHFPRHLMLNLLAVERMIQRGGKISGVFGS